MWIYHFQKLVVHRREKRPTVIEIRPFLHCQWRFRIYEAWILQLVHCNMIIRIPGSGWATPTHSWIRYAYVCRSLYSFYFLACIMHVEASLHCQWRIGKVPPISDRRHFSSRNVCRRFLKNVLTRSIVQVPGKLWKFLGRPGAACIHLFRKIFADNIFNCPPDMKSDLYPVPLNGGS